MRFKKLAYFVGSKWSNGKTAPIKVESKVVWRTFWLCMNALLGGSSLVLVLPEFLTNLVIKLTTGWDDCGAVTLMQLSGSLVASAIISCVLGTSVFMLVVQLVIAIFQVCANVATIATAVPQLVDNGMDCWTALVSLCFSCLELTEDLPTVPFVVVLIAVRWYQDEPDFPLVNLYLMLPGPSSRVARCVPRSFRASELYNCEAEGELIGARTVKVAPCEILGEVPQGFLA